jgi:hypothetical protein
MATTPFTAEGIPTYMLDTPNAQMSNPQDSATLPMFNPQNGFSDSGVSSTNVNVDQARAGVDTTTGTDGENAAD